CVTSAPRAERRLAITMAFAPLWSTLTFRRSSGCVSQQRSVTLGPMCSELAGAPNRWRPYGGEGERRAPLPLVTEGRGANERRRMEKGRRVMRTCKLVNLTGLSDKGLIN
ncbi:hypothetical protein PMAYCL1PPCAC_00731, partial [Pristionchus mayeri]